MYLGECDLLIVIATMLDPRFKIVLVRFCFLVIYQELEATKNIEFSLKVLHELYDEYFKDHDSIVVEQSEQENVHESSYSGCFVSAVGRSVKSGRSMFQSFV
jgi:hypothetical protein